MLNTFNQSEFLRYMWKTSLWPLCSFFINCVHVFQQIKNSHISSMQDTPRNIHTKFGSNWLSYIRGEEFWKIVHDNRRRRWQTSSDGNNSRNLWPGELIKVLIAQEVLDSSENSSMNKISKFTWCQIKLWSYHTCQLLKIPMGDSSK